MAFQFDTATRNALADSITSSVGASGTIKIYDGTPPTSVGAALSGNNLLVTLPCSAAFAPAASGGVLTANAVTTTNAVASGTPTFARICTSGGTARVQCTVGTSGADAIISHSPISSGDPIAVNSLTLTMPGA